MIEVWLVAHRVANTSSKLNVKYERILSVHPLVKQEESIYQTSTETNGEGKESDEDR